MIIKVPDLALPLYKTTGGRGTRFNQCFLNLQWSLKHNPINLQLVNMNKVNTFPTVQMVYICQRLVSLNHSACILTHNVGGEHSGRSCSIAGPATLNEYVFLAVLSTTAYSIPVETHFLNIGLTFYVPVLLVVYNLWKVD